MGTANPPFLSTPHRNVSPPACAKWLTWWKPAAMRYARRRCTTIPRRMGSTLPFTALCMPPAVQKVRRLLQQESGCRVVLPDGQARPAGENIPPGVPRLRMMNGKQGYRLRKIPVCPTPTARRSGRLRRTAAARGTNRLREEAERHRPPHIPLTPGAHGYTFIRAF